jgi:hypothetical protein
MCPPAAQSKGRGERSGLWEFDSFEFMPGVFGKAAIEYESIAKRVKSVDREEFSLFSSPYEIEVFSPKVKNLVVFDDDGNEIRMEALGIKTAEYMILTAWADQHSEVLSFEMGLL